MPALFLYTLATIIGLLGVRAKATAFKGGSMKQYTVAILGATGAVGTQMLECLNEQEFPVGKLKLLASARSAGKTVEFRGEQVVIEEACPEAFEGCDIVLGAAGDDIAKELLPEAVKRGAVVVDNSHAFRMDPEVPLVVPEINADDIKWHHGLIANPNCATIIGLVPTWPLHQLAGVKRMIVSTYQAASGAGAPGMAELEAQLAALGRGEEIPEPRAFAAQLASNLIPQIGGVKEEGFTSEEMKLQNEGRKIMHLPELRVNCTCVRVPVLRSHSESITLEFERDITVEEARAALAAAPGVKLVDDMSAEDAHDRFPMPMDTSDQDLIWVGRVRRDISNPEAARALPSGAAATKSVRARQPTPSRSLSCSASSGGPVRRGPGLVFRTSSTMCGALSCSFGAADKAPHWSAECSENQARPPPAVTRLRAACDGAVAGWGRWADVGARGCCGP